MKEQQLTLNGRTIERLFRGLCIGIGLVLGAGTGVAIDNIVIVMGVGLMIGIAIAVYAVVNTSPKGFISDFSIGFLVGISAPVISSTQSVTGLITVVTIATIVVVLIDRSSLMGLRLN